MADETSPVRLTELVRNKLNKTDVIHGYLFGWSEGKVYMCADCANMPNYLLPGVECIGEFFILDELPENEEDLIKIAMESIQQGNEDDDSYFQLSGQDELLLFVNNSNQDNASMKAVHYFAFVSSFDIVQISEENADLENILLFRAKGKIPLIFEGSSNQELQEENLNMAIVKLKSLFMASLPVLFYDGNNTLLQQESSFPSSITTCGDFIKQLTSEGLVEKKPKKGKKLGLNEKVPITFKILVQGTGQTAVLNNFDHSLVIHCQRREFPCVSLHLPIDVVVAVEDNFNISSLYNLFRDAIVQQLKEFGDCLQSYNKESEFNDVQAYHFYPSGWKLPVTLIYPTKLSDDVLEKNRRELMESLLIPPDRPLFRKGNSSDFSGESTMLGYIINPHLGLPSSGAEGSTVAIVSGKYTYHHYMQDRINDDGWGCAYRSLQTIVSWFRLQGYTDKSIPSHKEIQQALVDIGDKDTSFVGSRNWIGSQEVTFYLDHLIGVTSKILCVNSGADMENLGRDLLHHFQGNGTPVMIGGGNLAHTILGVDYNQKSGALKFLVLDPHYTGSEDINVIQSKGWCGWKNTSFWNKTAFYNLCLPQRPIMI